MSVSSATPVVKGMTNAASGFTTSTRDIRARGRRIGIKTIQVGVLVGIVALALKFLSDPALAQTSTATVNTPPDPSASKSGFESMLGNLYTLASLVLKYIGFVALVLGPAIYFLSGSNSERSRKGLTMTMGGAAMIGLHYGFQAFIGALKWLATG
jgi:hypothetical protein